MNIETTWTLTRHSEEAWHHMLRACASAKVSIDIEQYIFGVDGTIIEEISEILIRKSREGVRVRLLLDAVGSFAFYRSALCADMTEAGIKITFHTTIGKLFIRRIVPFFLRDHRKLIVIDGIEAHIGGVIIEEDARAWRDTMAILTGPVVEECKATFEAAWKSAARMKPLGPVMGDEKKSDFKIAGNSYHLRDKLLYRSILKHITAAKHHVYITTPYFSLTHDLRRALMFANARGVEIILLFPRRSDNLFADCLARLYYKYLLKHGIRIVHYTSEILHAKTVSIDGAWATLGSCNLDWLSLRLNYELNVMSDNAQFVSDVEKIFLDDILSGDEVTLRTPGWYNFF